MVIVECRVGGSCLGYILKNREFWGRGKNVGFELVGFGLGLRFVFCLVL